MSINAFNITIHAFEQGGAKEDYVLKGFLLPGLKDTGQWKGDFTLYNNVQGAKSLILQVRITEEEKAFFIFSTNAEHHLNVPEGCVGWEGFVTES